jgi:uncharacterized protein (DUF2235 family)
MAKSKTRYVLFFDGTWNDPQDRTNVYKLARSLPDCDEDTDQRFFYDPGVGTAALGKLAGGTTGYGLSENLQEGYDWLARRYCEGDEIYVFGFSRGAYTARSFVGLIRKCGLLHIVTPDLLDLAESLYRDKAIEPDAVECLKFRENYSREVRIRMIGVWDTVGSLGVPGTTLTHRGYFSWHDTQLSSIVDYAAQAMALDEHREAFDIEFWTSDDGGNKKPDNVDVEQRWFIGAHANVGGGYGDDALADLSFVWMQQKAQAAGLKLKLATAPAEACMTPIRDSYKEFGGGAYAMIKGALEPGDGRHVRRYDTNDAKKKAVNVTVDPSVWERWQRDAKYRPKTLVKAKLTPPGV